MSNKISPSQLAPAQQGHIMSAHLPRTRTLSRLTLAIILSSTYGCATTQTPQGDTPTPETISSAPTVQPQPPVPTATANPAISPMPPAEAQKPPVATPAPAATAPAVNPTPTPPVEAQRPSASTPAAEPESPDDTPKPTVIKGNDNTVKLPPPRTSGVVEKGAGVTLEFEQAPVTEVVHAVLGDMLKLNYTIQQPLTGEITLHTRAAVPRDQVLGLLDSLLAANGLAMSRDGAGIYHVAKAESLKPLLGSSIGRPGALPPGYGTVIIPLKYIGVGEMAEILKPIAPAEAFLRVDGLRNILLMSGSRTQLDAWMEVIDTFDVDFLSGMSVGVFPLENASVKDVVNAMQAVLAGTDTGAAATAQRTPTPAPRPAQGAQQQAPRIPGAPSTSDTPLSPAAIPPSLAGLVKVLPIERLNSLIVVTPRAEMLEKVRTWIEKIDHASIHDTGNQLWVYKVTNSSAGQLASLLGNLFGSGASTPAPAARATDSGANVFGNNSLNRSNSSLSSSSLGSSMNSAGGGAVNPTTTQQITIGDVRVVADSSTNSLLIYGSRKEYKNLEAALKRLDVMPSQVLLEANIVEVTLNDNLQYGVQWYFNNDLKGNWRGDGVLGLGTPTSTTLPNLVNQSLAIVPPSSGQPAFNYLIKNGLGEVQSIISALAAKSTINVISSPHVVVLDNQTANMSVGTQQPVQTASYYNTGSTTNSNLVSSNIQYKDTGVMLNVTPTINSGGLVTLNINQQVIDIGNRDSATGQYTFQQRQINTKVAVRDGSTIVLGGLIKDNDTTNSAGLPWLHSIPVVGALFGQQAKSTVRTELILLITPRVMRSDEELRSATDELKARVTGLADSFRRLNADRTGKKNQQGDQWVPGDFVEEPLPAPQSMTREKVLKPRPALPETRHR